MTLLLAACGGSEYDAKYAAERLQLGIAENKQGELVRPRCVPREENVFKCVADYRPSDEAMEEELRGIEHGPRDVAELKEIRSGQRTFEVTVDPADGTIVWE